MGSLGRSGSTSTLSRTGSRKIPSRATCCLKSKVSFPTFQYSMMLKIQKSLLLPTGLHGIRAKSAMCLRLGLRDSSMLLKTQQHQLRLELLMLWMLHSFRRLVTSTMDHLSPSRLFLSLVLNATTRSGFSSLCVSDLLSEGLNQCPHNSERMY